MIKVLYVTNTGSWAGSSVALKNIWSQLNDKIDIYVVFPGKGEFSEYAESCKYKCFYFKYDLDTWPTITTLRNTISFLWRVFRKVITQYYAYKNLCKIIRSLKPDVIHTNTGPLQFAAKAAKKFNVPHVWHLREYQAKGFMSSPYPAFPSYSLLVKRLKYGFKIAITEAVANYFNLESNYKVIYDGVISDKNYCPKISFDNSNYLLFVGRLEDNKGWKDALNAFISISNDFPEIRLIFVGSYNEAEINEVVQNIVPIELRSRIEFLGFRNDCTQLMQKARALLVPSYKEGFGFVTVEGMYNGCIVIGRNTTGTKEQFDNGLKMFGTEIGLRFDTQSKFESQIRLVLSKPKIHFQKMIINAQNIVIDLYSSNRNAEEIMSVYNLVYAD